MSLLTLGDVRVEGKKSEEGWVLILFLLQTSNLTIVIQEFGTLGFWYEKLRNYAKYSSRSFLILTILSFFSSK